MASFREDVIIEDHKLILKDGAGNEIGRFDQDGNLIIRREIAGTVAELFQLRFFELFGGRNVFLTVGADEAPGAVLLLDGNGGQAIGLSGRDATVLVGRSGNGGDIRVRDVSGRDVHVVNGFEATLTVGTNGNDGDIFVRGSSGANTISMRGESALLTVGVTGNAGDLWVRDESGRPVLDMDSKDASLRIGVAGKGGNIFVTDDAEVDRIHLDGNNGDIRLMGADLAEELNSTVPVEPGSVLVAVGPDEVAPASKALDRRVIGVASGAGDLQPALRLGSRPGEHRVPVALVGRVYCMADAVHGAIVPGDLLTTSTTMGHAMRVDDPPSAIGAIVGKALASLSRGTGLIPVLLTQQ
ncbi:hypothetical protein MLGJGCBP_04759 [Rhodococcus sp. T7]|nr:hypothetical protein MLGJGCBP_09223 [Rhodococcus sp. T7]KAF0962138.1 hypothetical protein MLGJGCBP_04759 [Rhodococcus sp. T7]